MPEQNQQSIQVDGYDLFVSYSMAPDYELSRRIENFLEGFHKLKISSDIKLKPLQVCRDGSSFSLHKIEKESADKNQSGDYVQQVLVEYLQRSKYLLVLCSYNAAKSRYVNFEISWFIQHKEIDKILIAVTEGEDLSVNSKHLFPVPAIEKELHERIYYDLRGYRKESKRWLKVRAFDEELTKLAAHLNDQAPDKILPAWRQEETKKLKRQRYIGGIAALVFLMLAVVAYFQRQQAIKNEEKAIANKNEALNNLKKYKVEQFGRNMRDGLIYFSANEDSFALREFLSADSIIAQYSDDTELIKQKDTLYCILERYDYQKNNK